MDAVVERIQRYVRWFHRTHGFLTVGFSVENRSIAMLDGHGWSVEVDTARCVYRVASSTGWGEWQSIPNRAGVEE